MPVNWNILANAPDPGQAFAVGVHQGQAFARQRRQDNALAVFAQNPNDAASVNALLAINPELGFRASVFQRENAKRDVMGRLFDPPAGAGPASGQNVLSGFASAPQERHALEAANAGNPESTGAAIAQDRLGSPPHPVPMNPEGMPPTTSSAAPRMLLDPSRLPPRTDRLRLNHEALRELYRLDPEAAITVQKHVFDANQAQFKSMQQNGATLASAAFHLKGLPVEQRAAELEAMAPQLMQMGIGPDQLAQADLSDTGLDRYIVTGQAIGSLLRDDRAERRFDHDVEDDEADNARADRNTDSIIAHRGAQEGIARRGQNIASSDRRRGQDQADARARRGQDMADKRVRESAGFRGKGGNVPTATNPQTGEKLEFRNGKWGPAK